MFLLVKRHHAYFLNEDKLPDNLVLKNNSFKIYNFYGIYLYLKYERPHPQEYSLLELESFLDLLKAFFYLFISESINNEVSYFNSINKLIIYFKVFKFII